MRLFVGALFITLTVSTAAGAEHFGLRVSSRLESRTYESHLGEHEIDQRLLSADVLWEISPVLRLEAAAEALDNETAGAATRGEWGPVRSLHGALRLRLFGGRAAIAAGGSLAMVDAGLTAVEAATASELDDPALDLPRPSPRRGGHPFVSAATTLMHRGGWRVHAAIAEEWALEHELLDVGSDIRPGGRIRLALQVGHEKGEVTSRLTLRAIQGVEPTIDGKAAYETGDELSVAFHAERTLASERLFADVETHLRGHGEPLRASLLDVRALRGGNQGRASLGWRRSLGSGQGFLALETSMTRGFSGHVGHATWVGPRVGYSHPLGVFRVALEARGFWGQGRASRSLSGTGFGIAVSHGLFR